MRHIVKSEEPRALLNWKSANRATPQNLVYGEAGFPREAVRQALLAEQYHLCAYTMKRLFTAQECRAVDKDTAHACHVEHVLPQSRGNAEETIDYRNMVACFPPSDSKIACGYGAHAKASYDPDGKPFISPLEPAAELHFRFDRYGGVEGVTPAGRETVKVLRLNHKLLELERAEVIGKALEPKPGKQLSAAQARSLAETILQPDAKGCLAPYCVAVSQAALAYAEREDRRAARMKKKSAS